MAFAHFCFVCMTLLVVTSAMPSRSVTEEGECSEGWLRFKYDDCFQSVPAPPSASEINFSVDVFTAQTLVTVIEDVCSWRFVRTQQCFRDAVESHSCPNISQIMERAERTSGLCDGAQPASWLREGLLDRMTDLHKSCLAEMVPVGKCLHPSKSEAACDDYYDQSVKCLVKVVKESDVCDKLAVFTVFLMNNDMQRNYGRAPSPQTLEALRDVQF